MRKKLISLSLIFAGILAGLVIAEIIVRAAYPRAHGPYISDERAFYTLKPNWQGASFMSGKPFKSRINKLGLRGPDISETPKSIVLCIGDSFTYGAGVTYRESFPGQLNGLIPGRFRALNGGVIGYNLSQYFSRLVKIDGELRPAIVVLAIFANDWDDLGYTTYLPDAGGNLVIAPQSGRASDFNAGNIHESWEDVAASHRGKALKWAITHSRLAELVYMRIFYARMARKSGENTGGVRPGDWQRYSSVTRDLLLGRSNAELDRIWKNGLRIIEEMNAMVKGWDGKLIVTYIPFEDELTRQELDRMHDNLYAFLNERNIQNVDLLPLFRSEKNPQRFYLPADGHLTVEGNNAVATALSGALQLQGNGRGDHKGRKKFKTDSPQRP